MIIRCSLLFAAAIFLLILISGCTQTDSVHTVADNSSRGLSPGDTRADAAGAQTPPGSINNSPSQASPFREPLPVVPPAPSEPVPVYSGVYMSLGLIHPTKYSMSNISALKTAGVNTVAIGTYIKVNKRGEARLYKLSDTNPNDTSYYEFKLAEQAKKYYDNGIRVFLVPDLYYEPEFSKNLSEPMPVPATIVQQPGFLNNYSLIVKNLSILAEKNHVEFFSPMNEPDRKLGVGLASSWGQAILPDIRSNYHGKVVYKAAYNTSLNGDINFRGYDVIGFSTSPQKLASEKKSLDAFRSTVNQSISEARIRAEHDNVSSVFLTEIGVWGGAESFSPETKAQAHRIAFEQGKGRVQGFFVADPITGSGSRYILPVRNSEIQDEMAYWFRQGYITR